MTDRTIARLATMKLDIGFRDMTVDPADECPHASHVPGLPKWLEYASFAVAKPDKLAGRLCNPGKVVTKKQSSLRSKTRLDTGRNLCLWLAIMFSEEACGSQAIDRAHHWSIAISLTVVKILSGIARPITRVADPLIASPHAHMVEHPRDNGRYRPPLAP
ncbi:hypothetical protein [Agrobacterium genomosp. 2]|uniref:hypothetical protein n=1 Tax=Agrobacterium genomosp. 2 TaxID=1183409 RepID=UPI001ABEF1EB|nr:hypothetical protein [Agrobacterium genomosp. 2]